MSRSRKDKTVNEITQPTPEQMLSPFVIQDVTDKRNGGGSITIGKAYRRRPMIDVLFAAGMLDEEGYKALRHYRHHADLADRSLVRDSLCLQGGGNGSGPTITTLNAIALVRDCEAAAGSLVDILRAVVVYDQSLSQIAIARAGGLEEAGRKGVVQIKPHRKALEIAKLEFRVAAQRVQAELDA